MTNTLKPTTVSGSTPPQPTTVFFNGRGGTGKTMLARLHAEWALQNHAEFRILDLDRTNATLSAFFPDHTDRPPTADDNDVMNYLRDAINEQTTKHHHLIIDFGGGDLILKSLASRIRLVPFFRQYNILKKMNCFLLMLQF